MKACLFVSLCIVFTSFNAQISGRVKPPDNSVKSDTLVKDVVVKKDSVNTTIDSSDSKEATLQVLQAEKQPIPCDTIFLINGKKILARDIYFQFPDVLFMKVDSTVDVQRSLPKNKIRCIVYANGKVEVCSVKNIGVPDDYSMFQKGRKDADIYYTHSGGSVGIGFATFLTGGIIGVIPAAICSSVTPKYKNLGIPANAPYKNKDYVLGYTYRAKKIKQNRIWAAYGVGFAGAVAAFFVLTK